MARRHKRLWTDEEKRSICQQTRAPGVSVAQVARRYAVNANLIFKWLRDPRYVVEPGPAMTLDDRIAADAPMRFLPVDLIAEASGVRDAEDIAADPSGRGRTIPPGLIEIELAGGHRLRITGGYDPDALARLLRGLSA